MFQKDGQAIYCGVTPLENLFITDYMQSAKGDYIKVYLLALYYSNLNYQNIGQEELAKELELPVSQVEAALRYWERRGIMARVSGNPPQYTLYNIAQRTLSGLDKTHQVDGPYVQFAENIYALFGEKRNVRPSEISLAYEWVEDMGLSAEVVIMLINHMFLTRGTQFSFTKAQKVATQMQKENVRTFEDAESFLRFEGEVIKGTQSILRRMGKRRPPSEDELALYIKWTREWKFEKKAISSACASMVSGDPSFKYLDGILDRVHRESDTKTEGELAEKFATEQDEFAMVRALLRALGSRATSVAAKPLYTAMVEQFGHDMMLIAANECNLAGVHTFESLQSLLTAWQEKGIQTATDAILYVKQIKAQNAFLSKMFENCGHAGKPNVKDRELLTLWKSQNFTEEMLLFAASQAFAIEGGKMRYIAKVLSNWLDHGIRTIEDAKAQSVPQKNQPNSPPTVSAQAYTQREYTEKEMEKHANIDDLFQGMRENT